MNQKIVLVSTDEPVVEIGVKTLLGCDAEFRLAAVCHTHAETLAAARQHQPDVAVCGVAGQADLHAIRELREASPGSAMVLWTREISTEVAHHAVEMGVRGFLSTKASAENFLECVSQAARGELWMEGSLTMSLLNSRPVKLSKRQSELVSLLVQGLKNKEIALALGLSEGTVKAYLTTLYEKVGARDRFDLALYGLKNMGMPNSAPPEPRSPLRSLVRRRHIEA